MLISEKVKLEIVVRPVSIFLIGFQALIFVAALVAAMRLAIPFVRVLGIELASFSLSSSLAFFTLALVLIGAVLFKAPAIRKFTFGLPARVKRLLFLACDRRRTTRSSHQARCLMVTPDFQKIKLPHPTQKSLIETLFESIESNDRATSTYDVILAPSGFGKTRAVTLLAEALIRDRSLCLLADNFHYYDFARGFRVEHSFLKNLGSLTHLDAIVVIDNFHLAEADTIRQTTTCLLDEACGSTERHLIILAQPLENWRIQAGTEIRLLSHARQKNQLHSIKALSNSDIQLAHLSQEAHRRILAFADYSASGSASIAQIQSAQIEFEGSRRQKELAKIASDYLFSVQDKSTQPPSRRLVIVMATATALSIFKGAFDYSSFRKAFFQANGKKGVPGILDQMMASRELTLLSKAGIIPRSSLPGRLFVMHERLAEHLRDTLGENDNLFSYAFEIALRWRLSTLERGERATLKWLAGVELHDQTLMTRFFDHAMSEGNLRTMGKRLERAVSRLGGMDACFQLGVILDKSGQFKKARKWLGTIPTGNDTSVFSAMAQLALVEADHGPDSLRFLAHLSTSPDERISLAARYWHIHIDAHNGIFNSDGLMVLNKEIAETFALQDISNSYFLTNLASRVYFDTVRHLFLRRSDVSRAIQANRSSPLANMVAVTDPCFKANNLLYEEAHVLSFLMLPALAIFNHPLSEEQLPGVETRKETVEQLCLRVEQAYKDAKDEFEVFGNREQLYLDGDLVNVSIQNPASELTDVRVELEDYSRFIEKSGFLDIASYPQIYAFRLAIRSHRDILIKSEAFDFNLQTAKDYERDAQKALMKIRQLDERSGNAYGLWRVGLYQMLFDTLRGNVVREELIAKLRGHADEARKKGYSGEYEFLERLLEMDDFKHGTITNVILFHPFVHQ